MGLPRMRSPRGATSRRVALWSALAVGWYLALGRLPGGIRGHDVAFGQVHARRRPVLPGRAGIPLGQHPGGDAAGADAGHGHRARRRRRSTARRRAPVRSTRSRTSSAGRPDINVSPLDVVPQIPPGGGPAPQPPAPGINAPGGNLCRRVTRHRAPPAPAAARVPPPPPPGAPPAPRARSASSTNSSRHAADRRECTGRESAGRDGVAQALGAASESSRRRDYGPERGRSRSAPSATSSPTPAPRAIRRRDRRRLASSWPPA